MSTWGLIPTTSALAAGVSTPPRCELSLTADQSGASRYLSWGTTEATEIYKSHPEMRDATTNPTSLGGAASCAGATYAVGCALLISPGTGSFEVGLRYVNAPTIGDQRMGVAPEGMGAGHFPTWVSFEIDQVMKAGDLRFRLFAISNGYTVKAGSRFWLYQVA